MAIRNTLLNVYNNYLDKHHIRLFGINDLPECTSDETSQVVLEMHYENLIYGTKKNIQLCIELPVNEIPCCITF